jgi:hypothetical protein
MMKSLEDEITVTMTHDELLALASALWHSSVRGSVRSNFAKRLMNMIEHEVYGVPLNE